MKKLLLLLFTLVIILSSCKKESENVPQTIHVKITNNLTYIGSPEGIINIIFETTDGYAHQTGYIGAIPYGGTFDDNVTFWYLGELNCRATPSHAGFLTVAQMPSEIVTVNVGGSVNITFSDALP